MHATHYTHAPTSAARVPQLDATAGGRMIYLKYYDPTGARFGLPTYPYRWAPQGLLTARQLRAEGLRPGGQPVFAQILWRDGARVAYLYRRDLAKPKRTATPAQRAAIDKALKARRTCSSCGQVRWYYIPRSLGECLDCAEQSGSLA
ncbi:RRQRL motif-containing zinc-binding protein [Actinomadura welshii]|uniref:RRQRL motif-containing zinc-binding protein n=1 Tax=Actinomadura welshii TaxID=3103817 RepID=UPI0003AD42F2|nr:RRQRL motif-containing zinc-binding protein [Actinomadura madurae]